MHESTNTSIRPSHARGRSAGMPEISPAVRAETYKLARSWTPRISALVLLLAAVGPSLFLLFRPSTAPATYFDAYTGAVGALAPLVGAVFGAWLLGSEYRQQTVRRMLSTEPRRLRVYLAKAAVGLGALAAAFVVAAGAGWASTSALAASRGATFASPGDALIDTAILTTVVTLVAFGLSAVSRSDAVSIAGTLGMLIIVDPLITILPTVGRYSFGSGVDWITQEITGVASESLGTGDLGMIAGAATLLGWLAFATVPGAVRFVRGDV